jgi:hypothetical protein
MNIFIVDWDHTICAQWHCNKHVVKMPLETTQMLSTVHHRYSNDGPFLPVHQKHPCTLWAGQTIENYRWLWRLGIALCKEYTYRYEKTHACERILAMLRCPPVELQARGFTKPAQAMPDEYKHSDTLMAYQNYYIGEKARLGVWHKRPVPPFMEEIMLSRSSDEKTNQTPS